MWGGDVTVPLWAVDTPIIGAGANKDVLERNEEALLRLQRAAGLKQLIESGATTKADIRLARDDAGWIKLGESATGRDMAPRLRESVVKRARTAALEDGICSQTIGLYTDYALGDTGFSVRAEDDAVNETIQQFLTSNANADVFSSQGQRILSDKLLTDGEVFLTQFEDTDPTETKVRDIDTLEITAIAYDPEDRQTPRYYKRACVKPGGKDDTVYYADWRNDENEPGVTSEGEEVTDAMVEPGAPIIYHVKLGPGRRGRSILTTVLDWARAHYYFMRARVSIQQARAQFANELIVKGGQTAVNSLVDTYQSTLYSSGEETKPPAAPGSTDVHNRGIERRAIPQDTGASSAQTDGGMLLQRAGLGAGIFPHYYGAGESFRLATATAMEAPMGKRFGAYRRLLHDVIRALVLRVLTRAGVPPEKRALDIDAPPMLQDDIGKVIHAIFEVVQAFPALADSDQLKELVLTTVGLNNASDVLKVLADNTTTESAAQAQLARLLHVALREARGT